MQVVRITGGLGNQMFQYAFGEYLKKVNHDEFYLDLSDYEHHQYHQGFELDKVFKNTDVKTLSKAELDKIRVDHNAFLFKVLEKLLHVRMKKPNEFHEYPATLAVKPNDSNISLYYDGYWGMAEYLNTAEEEIRKAFEFKYVPEGKNKELLDLIEEKGNTVGVHVRRGDYLWHPNLANVCDVEYYKTAIQYFLDQDSNCVFIVFSDDIPWVKENLSPLAENMICVDWNTGEDSNRDMQMMSLCHHNILANSTFSWWAAWLNKHPDKQAVIPGRWTTATTTAECFKNRHII